jgi:hypothetical protein
MLSFSPSVYLSLGGKSFTWYCLSFIHLLTYLLRHSLTYLPLQPPILCVLLFKLSHFRIHFLPHWLNCWLNQRGTPSLSHGHTSLSLDARRTTRSSMIYRRCHYSCSIAVSRWHWVLQVAQHDGSLNRHIVRKVETNKSNVLIGKGERKRPCGRL